MIVSHLDTGYLEFAKTFLYSINKYAPQERIYLSTINLVDSQKEYLTTNFRVDKIVNHILKLQEPNKHLLQNRVTKVIVEALQSNCDTIYIVTNIDMIVRRPLSFLYEKMQGYDIALCLNSSHPRRKPPQIMNGFLVFNIHNPKVLEFATEYDQEVHKEGKEYSYDGSRVVLNDTFHRDQEILHSLYLSYKSSLRFLRLEYHKFFTGAQKDGVVWSAGRKNKYRILERFKREVDYTC